MSHNQLQGSLTWHIMRFVRSFFFVCSCVSLWEGVSVTLSAWLHFSWHDHWKTFKVGRTALSTRSSCERGTQRTFAGGIAAILFFCFWGCFGIFCIWCFSLLLCFGLVCGLFDGDPAAYHHSFHPPTLYSRDFDSFDVYDFLNSADEGYTRDHCVMNMKNMEKYREQLKPAVIPRARK